MHLTELQKKSWAPYSEHVVTCFHARTILSTTDKMADVFCGFKYFFFFISYKKNKICNSCFLAKTKREGNEIVVLCWFCQNFSKVHSKYKREKTPLKVDPLGKKCVSFLKDLLTSFCEINCQSNCRKMSLVNLVLLPELKYYDISLIDLSTKYFLRYNF